MTCDVLIDGRAGKLTVEGSQLTFAREDGGSVQASFSVVPVTPGTYSVLLDGRSYRGTLGTRGEIHVNGVRLAAEVFDPRELRAGNRRSGLAGRQEVLVPMPGKVVRVLVTVGDSVEEGQGLVVVEAMKMQNEMKSPKKGRVAEVRVKADATVSAGEVLVVVE
jgi:biotin carboxyl carrier protein